MTATRTKLKCKHCGSMKIWKAGVASNGSQRYTCGDCKRKFTVPFITTIPNNGNSNNKSNGKNTSSSKNNGKKVTIPSPVPSPVVNTPVVNTPVANTPAVPIENVEKVNVIDASLAVRPLIKKRVLGIGIRAGIKKDEEPTDKSGESVLVRRGKESAAARAKAEAEEVKPIPVSAGPVDKAMDLQYNPSRDAIRGVTVIDRVQGRLLPQMDMVNTARRFCIEIATYRQSPQDFALIYGKPFPIQPDLMDELMYRMAQWQKSVGGKSLSNLNTIVQTEKENQADDEGMSTGKRDPFEA